MTYLVTNKALKRGILRAFKNKTLMAMHMRGCCYRVQDVDGKDLNCAVGAGLPKRVLDRIEKKNLNGCGVSALEGDVLEFEDYQLAEQLQDMHDRAFKDDPVEHEKRLAELKAAAEAIDA